MPRASSWSPSCRDLRSRIRRAALHRDGGRFLWVRFSSGITKTGNASDTAVRDAGILFSLLLQHGCAAETISHAVSRNSDGSANGIVGAVVDLILARSP